MSNYGIPKAWGGRTVWNSEGKGGLSILEFPKARGGLVEDAARGRVWIFSGITQSFSLLFRRRLRKYDSFTFYNTRGRVLSRWDRHLTAMG